MQIFRAHIQNSAGAVTWAAWIQAAHQHEAQGKATALCQGQRPTVDLWFATERKLPGSCTLEPV